MSFSPDFASRQKGVSSTRIGVKIGRTEIEGDTDRLPTEEPFTNFFVSGETELKGGSDPSDGGRGSLNGRSK